MFNPSSGTESREPTFANLSVRYDLLRSVIEKYSLDSAAGIALQVRILEANDQIIEPLQVRTFHGSCEFYLVEVATSGKHGIPDDAGKARKCFTQLISAL